MECAESDDPLRPLVGKPRCEKAEDSKYVAKQLAKEAAQDPQINATLADWRSELARREFVVLIPEAKGESVSFEHGRFILSIGGIEDGGNLADKLQQSVIVGPGAGGLSIGTWKRVRWVRWSILPDDASGHGIEGRVELAGVPKALKERLEDEFGKSIQTRWRWRGLPKVQKAKFGPVPRLYKLSSWLVPDAPSLEFVDGTRELWAFK